MVKKDLVGLNVFCTLDHFLNDLNDITLRQRNIKVQLLAFIEQSMDLLMNLNLSI